MADDYETFLQIRAEELHRIALGLVGEVAVGSVTDVPPAEDEVTVEDGAGDYEP